MRISHQYKFILFCNPKTGSESFREMLDPYSDDLIKNIKDINPGKTWNTIGGLPYRVDSYLGYNAGLMVELFFDLSTTDIDDKIKKSKIGIKSGVNYSSQGVTVEDVNKTRFENNMVYLQIPILLDYKIQKLNFFIGPQIHLLQDFTTIETRTSNLSSNATSQNPDFKFEKKFFEDSDPNFLFGIGLEVYDGLSVQIKSLRSLKNITNIDGEEWKNTALLVS